jgi:chromosome segregation ATPase
MSRRFRRLAHLGISGWIMAGRRIAPWGLLVFALFQLKALSDKVRQVEDSEFSQVQSQVDQLRTELTRLSDSARDTEHELYQTRQTLKLVNQSLEQAKKRAPELTKAIDDANQASAAVKSGLPQAEEAAQLSATLAGTSAQLAEVAHALPEAKAAAALVPDVASVKALAALLDDEKKQLEAVQTALPKAEQAQALAKSLDSDAAALAALKDKTPNAEQLQVLQKDLAHAHEVLANIAPPVKPVAN